MTQVADTEGTLPTRAELVAGLVSAMANPARSPILRSPADDGIAFSDIFFPAMDGVTIEGWYIPGDSDRLIIANHPIWANRYGFPGHLKPYSDAWEASGNNIEVNFMPDYKHLHEAGYHILAYDLRNFGQSAAGSGGAVGNGIREYRDVIGSLRYVRSQPDLKDLRRATSMELKDMDMPQYATAVDVPTLLLQVRNDTMTTPDDVQAIFDAMPTDRKDLIWIEGTNRRFDGYNYLPQNPQPMLDWFERFVA
ncbi:alpha/beta hydrolase family protein [Amycolatopsis sp. 3B14]|uniref:alpha/beta hydrolase family protein n=1 Tax=Amycolatopsis sp. 3B14 TaxID=3243600 RepID=UPI003D970269